MILSIGLPNNLNFMILRISKENQIKKNLRVNVRIGKKMTFFTPSLEIIQCAFKEYQ